MSEVTIAMKKIDSERIAMIRPFDGLQLEALIEENVAFQDNVSKDMPVIDIKFD